MDDEKFELVMLLNLEPGRKYKTIMSDDDKLEVFVSVDDEEISGIPDEV